MAVKTEKQEYMGGTQGDQNQQDLVTDGMWGRREGTKSKNICTQRYAKYTSYSSSDLIPAVAQRAQSLETNAHRLAQSHMAKKSRGQDADSGFQAPSQFLFSLHFMDSKAG